MKPKARKTFFSSAKPKIPLEANKDVDSTPLKRKVKIFDAIINQVKKIPVKKVGYSKHKSLLNPA